MWLSPNLLASKTLVNRKKIIVLIYAVFVPIQKKYFFYFQNQRTLWIRFDWFIHINFQGRWYYARIKTQSKKWAAHFTQIFSLFFGFFGKKLADHCLFLRAKAGIKRVSTFEDKKLLKTQIYIPIRASKWISKSRLDKISRSKFPQNKISR